MSAAPKNLDESTAEKETLGGALGGTATAEVETDLPPEAAPKGGARPDSPPHRPNPRASKSSTRWDWNRPLLAASAAIAILGGSLLVGLYYWQSARVGDQLLQLADAAQAEQEFRQEVQWLQRYVALRPDDLDAQIRLAWAFDALASKPAEIDQSRWYLSHAITALEETEEHETRDALRRRLIDRMLELGSGWYIEAERQIVLLNALPGDPQALEQLARCRLALADQGGPPPAVPTTAPVRDEHFWKWAAAQTVGEVVRMAAEANPQSTELAGMLLSAYLDRPELFDSPGAPADHTPFVARAATVLDRLNEQQEDGHAQWLAYHFGSRPASLVTPQPLAASAASALERLQRHADSFGSTENADLLSKDPAPSPIVTSATAPAEALPPREPEYEPRWDAGLVLEQAENLSKEVDLNNAHDLYEALVALPDEMLPSRQLELAYWGLGQMRWELGEHGGAQEVWKTGNERLGGFSFLLLDPLAAAAAQSAPLDEAKQALAQLADAAEKMAMGLARARRHTSQRSEQQSRVNVANWRVEVLRAQIDSREGRFRAAIARLERALAAQLSIDPGQRIEAADLLARIYGEENLWDLAGRVLDEAVLLAPHDRNLRMRAAEAWQRAAVPSRAAGQLQHADNGTFEAAFAYAQTLATGASRQPPTMRDLGPVRAAVAEAEQRLGKAVEKGESPPMAWQLGLLKLALPTLESTPYDAPQSSDIAKRNADRDAKAKMQLVDLCLQYPQVAELQAIAALALQRVGDAEAADQAVKRIEAVSGVPPLMTLETRARLLAMRGATPEAVTTLREFAAANPEHRLRLTKLAASLFDAAGQRKEATELLLQLAPEERDRAVLMQLGNWLLEQAPSKSPAASPRDDDRFAALQEIERQLLAFEGEEGTSWRWLAANRLLQQAAGASESSPLLSQAARLQTEIVARRPRWSHGLRLGGRIAVAQGNPQQAVELLRRAIAEGDQDVETVLLLVRQLNRLGNSAAAEQELGRLERFPDATGQIAAMSVGLALGNGNFERAVERARATVAIRSDEPDALLILAQTAYLAAKADPERSEPLLAESADALNRAIELTEGANLGVWDAQFRFQLRTAGADAARRVLEAIEGSALAEKSRWLALAQGYLTLGDWQEARQRLEKAEQVNPRDANVHLAFADLHRAANETEKMLAALESANRLAPEREDIGNRLASALITNNPSEVPWERISQLIGSERSETTQQSQLYHTLLLITRGGAPQVEQATAQLRRLMRSDDQAIADDATRILATLERRRWTSAAADERQSEAARKALTECRRLYEILIQRETPAPIDLYGYGDLLLRAKITPDGVRIAERLSSIAPTSRLALDLRLRAAKQQGADGQLMTLVEEWLQQPAHQDTSTAKAAAGLLLSRLGSHREAIELLEQVYPKEPREFPSYVAVLSKAGELHRAAEACMARFREERSPEPVALLADLVAKQGGRELLTAEAEHVLADGVTEFPNSVRILESIGTLRLIQQQYDEAILFYSRAEKIEPNSLITLNNLAIALAEVPGREDEGLLRIERAIKLYGRNPELLDTLGVVQLRCEQLAEAEATLREAYAQSMDARHQFHLLLVLRAQKKLVEAEELWHQLDHSQLEAALLTPHEREQFNELRKQIDKRPPNQVGALESGPSRR